MRTMAHALLEKRYLKAGKSTRIVVLPIPESGLPAHLIEEGQPVPLDLLSNRPVRLELDDEGLSADLCFAGPPVRCSFPWEAVIAVQDFSDELLQTLVVTVATVMEDQSLRPTEARQIAAMTTGEDTPEEPPAKAPSISLIRGGKSTSPSQKTSRSKPRFEIINGEGER